MVLHPHPHAHLHKLGCACAQDGSEGRQTAWRGVALGCVGLSWDGLSCVTWVRQTSVALRASHVGGWVV